jgi:RecB family endonuclease NucS
MVSEPMNIERLERVPLREVWKHEAYDFSSWLAENLDVLNEHLEIPLVSAETEQAAGSFSVDLLAEDESGQQVVIENQLERSDHDHLGKVLTYPLPTAHRWRSGSWPIPARSTSPRSHG